MQNESTGPHPLYEFFYENVEWAIRTHVSSQNQDDVTHYLANLMVTFSHQDRIFSIRDREGNSVMAITDMLQEGDIRIAADSFEREKTVHKHIGDFLTFWYGLYPRFLTQLKLRHGQDIICDYPLQARLSYDVVRSFEELKDETTAKTFEKLSTGFEDYTFCLRAVGDRLGIQHPGRA